MTASPEIIVGITIMPPKHRDGSENLDGFMSNGLEQNSIFLYDVLREVDGIHPKLVTMPGRLPEENWDATNPFYLDKYTGIGPGYAVFNIDEFTTKYTLNVLLMPSVTPPVQTIKALRKANTKIIAVEYGHKFVMSMETMTYGHLYDKTREAHAGVSLNVVLPGLLDGVMYSPHFEEARQHIAYSHGVPLHMTQPCPYVWHPKIINAIMDKEKKAKPEMVSPYFSIGDKRNRSIYTVEPNVNVVKTNLVSVAVVELLEQHRPESFDMMYMFGAAPRLVTNPAFIQRVKNSPIASPRGTTNIPKVSFEGRRMMSAVYSYARVQFAHQWHCPLNYTLLEAAYYHHPLVHNSPFLSEMGYYYHMNNVFDAANLTFRALRHEERDDLETYNHACDKVVEKYLTTNPMNREGYRSLIRYFYNGGGSPITLPSYIEDHANDLRYGAGNIAPYNFLQ